MLSARPPADPADDAGQPGTRARPGHDAPVAERVPACDPLQVFAALAGKPHAQLLDWRASTGWAYVLAEPDETVTITRDALKPGRRPDAFRRLAAQMGRWARRAGMGEAAGVGKAAEMAKAERAELPVPFIGGAAGMFAYELAHDLEAIPARAHPLDTPVLAVGLYDAVLAIPADGSAAWLVSPWDTPAARARRARLRQLVLQAAELPAPDLTPAPPCTANFTRAGFERAVAGVVERIHAGDIFQANIAQRFETRLPADVTAFDIYRRLNGAAPAPFAAQMNFPGFAMISSSPERFLRCDAAGHVLTEPIKGTRPRGRTGAEDAALARELAASAKDRAENVMIVDLLRNDLSRVCMDHSIEVPALCELQSFANVHHLVSRVTGRLRPERGPLDLLAAAFPGGSITGAPKPEAMKVIAQVEPHPRGAYCGALGWIGVDGAMDTSIAIRTLTIAGRKVYFHAGGGIVADSEPAAEYEETLAKASAMHRALCAPCEAASRPDQDAPAPAAGGNGTRP